MVRAMARRVHLLYSMAAIERMQAAGRQAGADARLPVGQPGRE